MFIDSRELEKNQLLQADLCIIGAGAAGITIAREFIGTSKKVILLESGGFEFNQDIQDLNRGKNTGHHSFDLHVNRLRFFGGTTNHWAGHCRPLEAIDFEKKPWVPYSGWPINRSDLNEYYFKAQTILELGEPDYGDLGAFEKATNLKALELDNKRLQSVVYGQSPPTRFGKVYRQELENAANIDIYLYANVLTINAHPSLSGIKDLSVTSFTGQPFTVQANKYILATGGIENPRLLLLSNNVYPQGLGNQNDLVGRFFMDHLLLRPGLDLSFTHPGLNLRLYHGIHQLEGRKQFAVMTIAQNLLRAEKLANFRAHLYRTRPRYQLPIGGVFSDIDDFAGENPLKPARNNSIGVHLVLDPTPNPESRITLSQTDVDRFNQPRVNVKWLIDNTDLNNAYRAMELIALEFGRLGLGRGYSDLFKDQHHWPNNLEAGKHHCGTTRMADTPQLGVVDADCKVFGVDNLYIAGSSVFPTIGYANPTFTIVALALRLSDHIKSNFV